MLIKQKSNAFVCAMLAGLPAVMMFSSSAHAQYQVGSNGHLLDANTRIGSGGYNGAGTPHNNYNVNNNVVTGNVSGLNYFHGLANGEFDVNSFAGSTGSNSFERFNAVSAPVDYSNRVTGQPNYSQYYNNGNTVGLPPGYVQTPGGVGYTPAPKTSALLPTGYDTREQLVNPDPTKGNLPTPGELSVAGPVDPSGNQSLYSMSPLYGVRQNDATTAQQESLFNSKMTSTRLSTPADRAKMDPASIQKMRDELKNTVVPDEKSAQPGQPDKSPAPVPGSDNINQGQQLVPVQPGSTNLAAAKPVDSGLSNQKLGSSMNSGESLQSQLIVAPSKQSKQLAELEKRFAKNKDKVSDVEASRRLNEELRAQKATADNFDPAKKPVKPASPEMDLGKLGSANPAPATGDKPAAPAPLVAKPILTKPDNAQLDTAQEDRPYIITSLATGISAKGLADLMKSAEDHMRQGKFIEAVDTYDTAEQVAPNNPFVSLGRSFAELGASYYGKADQDLGRSISSDAAVLAGRYDLKGFLGDERLKFVQKDLQDIADHEKGARPLVLLAYISHNIGDDNVAAKNLTDAQSRGGYDELIKLMRQALERKVAPAVFG